MGNATHRQFGENKIKSAVKVISRKVKFERDKRKERWGNYWEGKKPRVVGQ